MQSQLAASLALIKQAVQANPDLLPPAVAKRVLQAFLTCDAQVLVLLVLHPPCGDR